MAHSTTRAKRPKPYRDYPLFHHASGRWAKKIKGRLHYFGKVADDPKGEAALEQFLEQRDRLYAGLSAQPQEPTIRDLLNRYLIHQQTKRDGGELSPRSFDWCKATCDRIKDVVGLMTRLSSIDSLVCDNLRESIKGSVVTRKNEIQRIRGVFKFAYDCGLTDRPIRYQALKLPSETTLRKHRNKQPDKLFEAAEIKAVLDEASPELKAMTLLAVNAAMGNTDCAWLELSNLDLETGWLDYPRVKNGLPRRAKLWPETVAALEAAIAGRKEPKDPAHKNLVFLTKYRAPWIRPGRQDNAISPEFRKLLNSAGCYRKGLGFYSLRHTFRTIADAAKDTTAVDYIMGHAPEDTGRRFYLQRIDDDRLEAVAQHVHDWLFPADDEQEGGQQ